MPVIVDSNHMNDQTVDLLSRNEHLADSEVIQPLVCVQSYYDSLRMDVLNRYLENQSTQKTFLIKYCLFLVDVYNHIYSHFIVSILCSKT